LKYNRTIDLVCMMLIVLSLALGLPLRADGPRDNIPSQVRPIPPVGNDLDPADRDALQADVNALGGEIERLRESLKEKPALLAYLPDVQIFYNAVAYPLAHHETIEPGMARRAMAEGMSRAKLLGEGRTPWTMVTGPRGYVSRIDGSVQPYVLSIPAEYARAASAKEHPKKYRLDVWGHGRDELLTELRFVEMDDNLHELQYLNQSMQPTDKFILSPYGRYITAYKFAGEIDGLEAIAAVKKMYPIDDNRMLAIGFSLGGTMAWQYGVHYPDMWAAIAPGAGLAETPEFLKVFQKEDVSGAPWYQQAMWHLYNSTDYVINLSNLPTIAYAGELDPQKHASDMMLKAADKEGVKIDRIIGKRIGHHFTLEAKQELDRRLDEILARGRDPMPASIRFTTWTLRYNKCDWLRVDGLEHHWAQARVNAKRTSKGFSIDTSGVTAFALTVSPFVVPGHSAFGMLQPIEMTINGHRVDGGAADSECGYAAHFMKQANGWTRMGREGPAPGGLHKIHGLQGPIDDAFMDHFLIVRPTGRPMNAKCGAWEAAECDHAIEHWFKQFRGNPRVKNDVDVTDADFAAGNVVLFGDPSSNRVIAKIAGRLPIKWTADAIHLGDRTFSADDHVPVLIYPNPLDGSHYVVLNSGFTYREYDYLNNARQTPKLPDYAVIDVSAPATTQSPGGICAAGFFDENWQLQADDGRTGVGVAR
jgi:pimeloyl-ACP methyl ester carboxylesterase